jgi:hypothetical protein
MSDIQPFTIAVSDELLADIHARVAAFCWHEMPDDGGWEYGANLDYMQELCAYWLEEYDWRKHEAALNGLNHYKTDVDGLDLHFIHEKGSGPNPMPLLISHGWPGSVHEFMAIVEPLAHPGAFWRQRGRCLRRNRAVASGFCLVEQTTKTLGAAAHGASLQRAND